MTSLTHGMIGLICGRLSHDLWYAADDLRHASEGHRGIYRGARCVREGTTWVKAPRVSYGDGFSECFLRTLITEGGVRTNQLYVIYCPREWVFLDRATDRQGNALKALVIDRNVSRCATLSEHVAADLTEAYLENAAHVGLDIQLRGKSGRTVVKLPSLYVQGFIDKLNPMLKNE